MKSRLSVHVVAIKVFYYAALIVLNAAQVQNCWAQQTVTVNPGENLQAQVDRYPNATTFALTPGIYRLQSVVPKSYDSFVGPTGRTAILSGAALLAAFTQRGSSWVSHVQVTQAASYPGQCGANKACPLPEDLFFDSVLKTRVTSLAAVGHGKWYLDYSTGSAYMGDNPSGHTVEMSLLKYAFTGTATGVTISNLGVEKYACVAQTGAVDASGGTYWGIAGSEVRFNHGLGIRSGDGTYIHDNYIHHNGELGVGGGGSSIVVQNNEIAFNNQAGYTIYWEAGGAKFTNVQNLSFQYNYCHHNVGPGFWTDLNATSVLCNGNQFTANEEAGVMIEISNHVTVSNNYIWNDAFNPDGPGIWWGDGILIEDSSYVSVYFNHVSNCMNGVGGLLQHRGYAPNGQLYSLQNFDANGNTITQTTGIALGIAKEASDFDNSVYTSWNNQLLGNTLILANPSGQYIYWMNQPMTVSAWTAVLAGK